MEQDNHELIIKKAQELLSKIGVEAEVSIEEKEGETIVVINATDDAAVLIGHHGRSLEAIQTILRQLVFHETQAWVPFSVTIGDYREKRIGQLKELVQEALLKIKDAKQPVSLYNLTPSERRVIHMMFAQDGEIESISEGEGRDRTLILRPRA